MWYDVWWVEYLDEESLITLENIIREKEKVAKHYNKKSQKKYFWIGDLVLKVILPMDKKLKMLGKWSPNWDGSYVIEKVFREMLMRFEK